MCVLKGESPRSDQEQGSGDQYLLRRSSNGERPDVSRLELGWAVGSLRDRQQRRLVVSQSCYLYAGRAGWQQMSLFVNTRGCGGSRGCGEVLSGRLGVVVRRWRDVGVGFDDEL